MTALWHLARPRGMPLVLAVPAVGFGFAHWEWASDLKNGGAFLLVLAAWWFLSAGTLWLNALLDRDEGEVLMATPRPVALPPGLAGLAYGALASAVGLAALAGPTPGACAAACAGLAVAYSHPRTAWKGHPWLGPATNLLGYGVLSPVAGWAAAGLDPTPRTGVALGLHVAWIGATYFGAQAFQGEEDARRGYRTLVVTHGSGTTIATARVLYAVAFGGLSAFAVAGWFPRVVLLAVPAWWALDRHLAAWALQPAPGAGGGRAMLRRATALAAAVLLTASAQHVWLVANRLPPAGQGTAWRPGPRP